MAGLTMACTPAPPSSTARAPVASATTRPSPAVEPQAPSELVGTDAPDGGVEDFRAQFVQMAPKDPPRDRGVITALDRRRLQAAELRARQCFAAAKESGWVRIYLVIADDGLGSARPWDGMARTDVGACAAAAFERERYTPPGTQTPDGPAVRTLMLRVDHGITAPQEYKVD